MAKNRKKRSEKGVLQLLRFRTTILILLILVLGFGAIVLRIGYLQLIQGAELQEKAVEQQLVDTTINSKRGSIYDAKGKILAQSASVWRVVLSPIYFESNEQREYVAQNLSKILGLDYKDLYKKTKQESYYVVIKRKIESNEREKILSFVEQLTKKYKKLGGLISLIDDYKRYYPYEDLAASVIGFTGSDDQGLEGVEYQYDKYLTGTPGRIITARNANQTDMPFQYEQNVEAKDGNSITLTIDETIQSIAEKYMKRGLAENQVVNRGVCIIMDVNTGGILAMVTADGYDLNKPYDLSDADLDAIKKLDTEEKRAEAESAALSAMWRNKAIADTYYPGSVFKMCTASMALNEGKVNDNSTFYCGGSVTIYDHNIHCHYTAGHGSQNFFQAIANSCNPAFIQIGNLVGAEKFFKYYEAFGFSEPTGIDLPGESDDLFFKDNKMSETDLAISSFGQGFSITPIQMLTACASIANGGKVVQPYVVQTITDVDGNVVKNTETTYKRQVISKETADKMCSYLERNTIQGGRNNGYVAGYRVGGKTGTSEKIGTSRSGHKDYIASFCGFAPADDAQVACLIFFDTPTGASYYGSQVSAPVFVDIMSEVLPYLEIQAEYSDNEKKYVDTVAGSYVGLTVKKAQSAAKDDGFTTTVKGSGSKVISQIPSAASKIPTGGNVVLYTDKESRKNKVTVPDMVGYGVDTVNNLASDYGLNVSFTGVTSSGNSVSTSQSIAPGSEVKEGTVISVKFGGGTVVHD